MFWDGLRVENLFFSSSLIFQEYFIKFPNNRCCVGQQPTLCLQLKINDQKDFNGHLYTKIVTNVYSKKIYGRKSLMQFDLA